MPVDALKVALLAAAAQHRVALHALHGELEHFLDRQLASDDLDAALAELAAEGLVEVTSELYLTTETGRTLMLAQWEEFFPA